MPIYTYRCENCGVQFDRRQSFSDDPLKVCPECEQEALRKVYLPVGIVFKGSGFYSTDNRSGKVRTSKSSDDEGAASKDKGEKKSETKETSKKKD